LSQILPASDDFAAGTPSFGALMCLYLGARLTTTAVTGIWNPSGAAFVARPIHSGYQTTNSYGVPDHNAAFHSSGTANRSPSAVLFRRPFGTDVIVTGSFEMRSLSGGLPGVGDIAPRGVIARCNAGTLAGDGTADVRLENCTAYLAAVYQKSSDSTLRLAIYRFNTGTMALVGTESAAIPTATLDFTKLTTLAFTVTGTGATVTLAATLRGFGQSAAISINRTDTDALRIVTAGRCGFMAGPERTTSGKSVVDLCHLLAVDESGTRTLQDEFKRLSLAGAKQTTADTQSRTGNYLSSAYYWDAGTFDGTFAAGGKTYTGAPKYRRNATANRSDFNHGVIDDDVNAGRLCIAQRPADSQFSQHRNLKVIIPTAPAAATGEVWAGIALRARQAQPLDENTPTIAIGGGGPNFPGNGTAGTAASGYLFVCRAKTSTQVIWQLHRLVNGSHLPLATLTENSPFSTTSFSYGGLMVFDFEVYPRNEADPFGPVELVCKVGGSLLAMALSASAISAGMLNPSAGVFVDNTSARIKSNFGEGIALANGFLRSGTAAADIDPIFEAWTQGTLTNESVLDEDQASIAVAGETAAAGTALDAVIGPDWTFEVEYVAHSISNSFASGHRQTMPRFLDTTTDALIRRQRLKFKKRGVNATELAALIAHWNAATAFNFTAPGESAIVCRYASTLRYSLIAPSVWEAAFDLEQLLP
jgi:hypothetical protein